MKKFRFSLSTLLKIRQQHVKMAQHNLHEALEHQQNAAHELEHLKQQLENNYNDIRAKHKKGITTGNIEQYHAYSAVLKAKINESIRLSYATKQRVDKRREELMEARKNLRVIEILEEKWHNEWQTAYHHEENKLVDDFATLHHSRKKKLP